MMKKKSIVVLILPLSNSALLWSQVEPAETKTNADKFQDYFYESLTKGIENYDKAIVSLQQCLKLEPQNAVVFELGKNYLAQRLSKCLFFF
jgi:hypothetical protein